MKKIKLYPIFVCFWVALALVVMVAPNAFADWQAQTPAQSTSYTTATMPAPNGLTASANSTWSTPQNVDGSNDLISVSCPTTTFCMAITDLGQASSWNGSTWSVPQIANPLGTGLYSVSCPTSTFCMAVVNNSYAFTWNGSTWTLSQITNTGGTDLYSVSCPTSTFCAAVGDKGYASTWNGSTWSTPVQLDLNSGLSSVSCPTSTFCVAVSQDGHAFPYTQSGWSVWPNIASTALSTISCLSATFCMAVNNAGNAFTWNGSTWTPSQIPGGNSGLFSVSCPTTSFCMATDGDGEASSWDGSTWSGPVSIFSHTSTAYYPPVSCPATTFCMTAYVEQSAVWNGTTTLSWTHPSTTTDALGNPLVFTQDILGCSGSNCSPNTVVANGLSSAATSYTSSVNDTCYAVESVSRSGSWTAVSNAVCVT